MVKPVTIKDVAARAGCSAATVSSVMNGKCAERGIPAATARRVRQTARELGYFPDLRARNIRRHGGDRPWVLAVVSAIEAPIDYVGETIRGMEQVIKDYDAPLPPIEYAVELYHAGKLAELSALRDGTRFNAAIITNTIAADDEFLARTQLPMPVVLWGRDIPGYCSVRNSGDSGAEAADILLAAGARRLAVLRPEQLSQATELRLRMFKQRARQKTSCPPDDIVAAHITEADGKLAMAQYLRRRGRKADGLFLLLDTFAPGAYQAIKAANRKIPGDIRVIGHDSRAIAAYLDPPLSTFSGTADPMRREAVLMLIRSLTGNLQQPEQRIFHNPAILRASTGHG